MFEEEYMNRKVKKVQYVAAFYRILLPTEVSNCSEPMLLMVLQPVSKLKVIITLIIRNIHASNYCNYCFFLYILYVLVYLNLFIAYG